MFAPPFMNYCFVTPYSNTEIRSAVKMESMIDTLDTLDFFQAWENGERKPEARLLEPSR